MAAETLLCPACMGRFAECRVCNGTANVKVRYVRLTGDFHYAPKSTELQDALTQRVAQEAKDGG